MKKSTLISMTILLATLIMVNAALTAPLNQDVSDEIYIVQAGNDTDPFR